MLSPKNFFNHTIYKIISVAFTALFSVYSVTGGILKVPEKAPDDFTPVIRFAACSDIHLDGKEDQVNAERFAEMFNECYAYSENHKSYNKLDAVMVCGDMTDWGRENEYKMYHKVVSENLREGTKMLEVMGNHEFIEEREVEGVNAFDNYKKYINEETEIHTVINGYHFIGISYSDKNENFGDKTKWLDEQLKIATKENKNKPVFVFQHPHPTLTVYGSVNWSEISIRTVLEKYPQVVNFSGHSHYCSADPRTLWQGSFTAMGTGALAGLMGNLNYINGDAYGSIDSGSYSIVEADAEGNIRIRVFDAVNKIFFDNCDYYLKNPAKRLNRIYNWGNMYSLDTRPNFPESAEIKVTVNENDETIITFPSAKGYFEAESYKVTVADGIKTVYENTVLSSYTTAVEDDLSVNLGVLNEGVYQVKIKPSSPYAKQGKALKGEITV